MSEKQAKINIIISMLVFGTVPIIKRFQNTPGGFLAFSRGLIGAATILLFMRLRGKKLDRAALRKNLPVLIVSGVLLGLNWIILWWAFDYIPVSVSVLIYNMAPAIVVLVSPIFLKERLTPLKLLCIGLSFLGMILVSDLSGFVSMSTSAANASAALSATQNSSGITPGTVGGQLFGIGCSLTAAMMYAATMILNVKIKNVPGFDKTAFQLLPAAIVMIPYILVKGELFQLAEMTRLSWGLAIVMCVVHTGIAYLMYYGSVAYIKGQSMAIISYLNPVVTLVLCALLLGESMSPVQILGSVLILGSAFVSEKFG